MDEARLRRKIAVIMAADVCGYSRLVAEDEDGTLKRLMEYREIFADFVGRGRGREAVVFATTLRSWHGPFGNRSRASDDSAHALGYPRRLRSRLAEADTPAPFMRRIACPIHSINTLSVVALIWKG